MDPPSDVTFRIATSELATPFRVDAGHIPIQRPVLR